MFQINGYNLPGLGNYAACVEHVNEKRPGLKRLRNTNVWGENTLPLVNWRDTNKRLQLHDAGTPDERWACVYHCTEVVGYFKDGRVLLDASYDSSSTRTFFDNLSPAGIWTTRPKRGYWAYRLPGDKYHRVNRDLDSMWDQAMLLGPDGTVLNPQDWRIKKTVADMPRRRELRAALKPFTTWFDAMTKCTGSLRSVAHEPDEEPQLGRTRGVRGQAVQLAVQNALNGVVDDHEVWRDAVWDTLAYMWGWGARRNVEGGPAVISQVRYGFFQRVFELFEGSKEIVTVMPAGTKP